MRDFLNDYHYFFVNLGLSFLFVLTVFSNFDNLRVAIIFYILINLTCLLNNIFLKKFCQNKQIQIKTKIYSLLPIIQIIYTLLLFVLFKSFVL